MKLASAERILVVGLVVYIVLDILLTPLARLETRPVSGVTGLGLVTLALLFAGLALAIVSLVLLLRRSARAATVSIVAAVLILPAVLAEQTGHFSSFRPPAAIEAIELVQVVVALAIIGVAIGISRTSGSTR